MLDSGLRLNLFGMPTVVARDEPVTLSPSATMVFAYLALAPSGGRPRSVAAAQLFADCSTGTARRRLNTALWRLRSEIRSNVGVEVIANVGGPCVGLDAAAGVTVDASVFQDLVAPVLQRDEATVTEADAARLETAASMYCGELLEACHDEWVLAHRNRIENLYLSTLDCLVRHHGERGDVAAVTRFGELALGLEPLREDVHRHLMTAYADAGRDDLVERQFERCRMVLLDELGADPMPETVALYARLARHDRSRSASVAALTAELERARREVGRLTETIDRALGRLRRMS
ncbi:hypothetical protein GCM10010109_60750 [Actinoplanes campanulatus]|nr:hypothetical protein GCM10010109_60750 [Actinoplanes campanulatus]GID39298.1 hypothetical protein Aca09nite_58040 [Actinoplanes campanulatus]